MRFHFLLALAAVSPAVAAPTAIDRQVWVSRHNPVLRATNPHSPLSVGNGEFAFTADVTGLQSLESLYQREGIPLETLARWAWHAEPNPAGYTLADVDELVDTHGKPVPYPIRDKSPAGQWLRRNPSDFPLGEIGFVDGEGAPLRPEDISGVDQTLDLWTGEIRSRFSWRGTPVSVSTVADPASDTVAVRAESPALAAGSLRVRIAFPRGHDPSVKNTPPLDWSHPESHTTRVISRSAGHVLLARERDNLSYGVAVLWNGEGRFTATASPHLYELCAGSGQVALEFSVSFSPGPEGPAPMDRNGVELLRGGEPAVMAAPPFWEETRVAAKAHWRSFWERGAAVDFSGSTDPRAFELERRIVLSLYLTGIQFGGPVPPCETGLTCSSWYGKHNTEMVWWHVAHFALWGHPEYTANALDWYRRTLSAARAVAAKRGLPGARWPKMVGPEGRESPGENPFIVWNQPHPIYLAELLYRADPSPGTLRRWRKLVLDTADCMSAMLCWSPQRGAYVLGPPLWIAQEIYDERQSQNPCYELGYWAFALKLAQDWRVRLGLPRRSEWDDQVRHLSPLPVKYGRYVALESLPDTWDNVASRHDHPSFLMALGMLPGDGVNPATMNRTLDAVLHSWDWETKIWGWDYPMIAMTATRLGRAETAVDILLKQGPNNRYEPNGHCPQRGDLALYLPANSSLLAAVALMVSGWDGSPNQPGIPKDGSWTVRAEGLRRLP